MGTRNLRRQEAPLHSELEAMRWGMESMLQYSSCHHFEIDCKDLIAMIKYLMFGRLSLRDLFIGLFVTLVVLFRFSYPDHLKFRYVLEESGDFGVFWSPLSAELHIHVRCLTMYGDLPMHPVAEVMFILVKSGQSASREEAVEEIKQHRSTVHPWFRSMVILKHGRIKPRSNHKLPEYPWTT
ncbi:hypothetical protein IGI04_003016 [Brassica rapa subsp. trilocularis]|uniref:RNase H type-1 domain-containing protein n=1 Tax=Brassica rapa subsp. trilocularis TaxID=1813537 RepID=A0ABQ7NX82_BRACM|nr:hypothetical protein IGI04_003016 [Brassica rapa subsp. trilocularis]